MKLCCRNERSGLVWMETRAWGLRGFRRGMGKEHVSYMWETKMLSTYCCCPDTKERRMKFMYKKWLYVNEELAYRKIINCTNKTHMINLGKFLDKVRHEWENRVTKDKR
jgi:hypothetical protein